MSLDLEALQDRLGERRFRRAESYAERGLVRILSVEGGRAHALAVGETGRTYVLEAAADGAGVCSCPDFGETGVCKHLGAAALVLDRLAPEEVRTLTGRLGRLETSLAFETAAALAGLILGLARTVPGALEALEAGLTPDPS